MRSEKPHIVLIDGRSGAGKTRLSLLIAEALGATVVHLDDVYPGWNGLARGRDEVIRSVVRNLTKGRPGRIRLWDWVRSEPGEEITVDPADVVIVEGCGISTPESRSLADAVLWVDCTDDLRAARLSARDGERFDQFRDTWESQELRHIEDNNPIETATVIVDSSS